MVHEEQVINLGPSISLDCTQCHSRSGPAHLLESVRKPYYFGIPLGTERHILVKCDVCGAEFFTQASSFDELVTLGWGSLNEQRLKLKFPLYAKILIAILAMLFWLPFLGLVIRFCLIGYTEYIRGTWRKIYKVAFLLNIVATLICIVVLILERK